MIPKKIHYVWFGRKPLPKSVEACIDSWKKWCPDYEIIQWDEHNYDYAKIPYMKEAYEAKRYAFVSDYARLDIVNSFGGFYLDTDVELVRPLDELRYLDTYMGMELPGKVNTGLGFGSIAHAKVLSDNMDEYNGKHFLLQGHQDTTTCVDRTDRVLTRIGLLKNDEVQVLGSLIVFPTEYFCPLKMGTKQARTTENTYSIHHYDASWYAGNILERKIQQNLLPLKIWLKTMVGTENYEKLKKMLR